MFKDISTPFFLMANSREIYNGTTPLEKARQDQAEGKKVDIKQAKKDTVDGLILAINATREWLEKNGSNPDVEAHLKNLEERIEKVKSKSK